MSENHGKLIGVYDKLAIIRYLTDKCEVAKRSNRYVSTKCTIIKILIIIMIIIHMQVPYVHTHSPEAELWVCPNSNT